MAYRNRWPRYLQTFYGSHPHRSRTSPAGSIPTGTPIAGWWMGRWGNIRKKSGWFRGTPISGNLHIYHIYICTVYNILYLYIYMELNMYHLWSFIIIISWSMICTQYIIYHAISKYPYDSYDVASRFIHNKIKIFIWRSFAWNVHLLIMPTLRPKNGWIHEKARVGRPWPKWIHLTWLSWEILFWSMINCRKMEYMRNAFFWDCRLDLHTPKVGFVLGSLFGTREPRRNRFGSVAFEVELWQD
jgi:hypothetical protein